jgi:DNA modification methylase
MKAVGNKETRNKRSVWTINTTPFKGAHFAVFPEALAKTCLLAGCPVGGTVLDPFFGSGTVGVVALQQGKHYIGIDLNTTYCDMAAKRIQDIEQKYA